MHQFFPLSVEKQMLSFASQARIRCVWRPAPVQKGVTQFYLMIQNGSEIKRPHFQNLLFPGAAPI